MIGIRGIGISNLNVVKIFASFQAITRLREYEKF